MNFSDKIRFSIVWKLNTKLFFRMLGLFLTLNVFLCLLFVTGFLIRAEQSVTEVVKAVNQTGLPTQEEESWLALTGYRISLQNEEIQGFRIPQRLLTFLPYETATGARSIDLPDSKNLNAWTLLENVTYNVSFKADNRFYAEANNRSYILSYHPHPTLRIFVGLFAFLLLIEVFMLLRSLPTGARMIRNTLRPIRELAETAKTLSTEVNFAPEQLKALAGKLDNINATKLDTRISLGETQSELKSLASAINGMLDRINESYRSQARFVSDASHELRTPISVIQGYANLLDRWGKNDETTLQESIDAIKEETANMKSLVEQLLFLARGDNNTITLQLEDFDLASLAEEVLRETQMIDGGHEYDSNITSVFINADKGLIKQAVRILIDNAMKYTPTGRRITVSVSSIDDTAHLTVQDEGIGIPAESVPKIFERFYRSDESRARSTGGTGLGLSIAKWITERHGGHLEILSRVDIGTRITMVLR